MTVETPPLAIVVLAAGKGTRMKSDVHKVLHPIAGRAMIEHLLASAAELSPARQVVITGHGREQIEAALGTRAVYAVQEPQLGTAHAVLQAQAALAGFSGDVLVLYADVPFVSAETMRAMIERLHGEDAPAVVVLGFEPADTLQYGRVIAENGRIAKMVEHKDASEAERATRLCNSGLMAARSADLFALLARVGNDNAQGEYYLPDVVNIALADGRTCAVVTTPDPDEVAGINSRAELAEAEARWQARRRQRAMDEGASLIAPGTVWFSWDTVLGRDVTIEPNLTLGPAVQLADAVYVEANVVFDGAAWVGAGARIQANLHIPVGTVIPAGAIVSRENLFSFGKMYHQSTQWTGRYSPSDRAREVLAAGPLAISGLRILIGLEEMRAHNHPPELVEDSQFDNVLLDLKTLQKRLNELITEVEREGEWRGLLEDISRFYADRIAPWLRARLRAAAEVANGLVELSPALVGSYVLLSQLFDQAEYVAFMSAAIAGLAGMTASGRGSNPKE